MRRAVDFAITFALLGITYVLVGEEFHTWRGALLLLLLVWAMVEVLVAAYELGDVGWTWRVGVHGLLGGAAVVAGVALSDSWRWPLAAAIPVGVALIRRHLFAADDDGDTTRDRRLGPHETVGRR